MNRLSLSLITVISVVGMITLSGASLVKAEDEIDCSGRTVGYLKQLCLQKEIESSIISGDRTVFTDILDHTYREAITFVQQNGIVDGYSDNSYKPNNSLNRAEFTKILIKAKLKADPTDFSKSCFPDVEDDTWFAKYVCYAKDNNILGGYPDGSFQPTNTINFAEASKIIVNTFDIEKSTPRADQPWYQSYMEALDNQNNIPGTIRKHNHNLTRGEMAEMIMRISKENTSLPSLRACDLIPSACTEGEDLGYGDAFLTGIDMKQVRAEWLNWINGEREKIGLSPYTYNNNLIRSAVTWSQTMKDKKMVTHKRQNETDFYNYTIVKDWFLDLNLDFENINTVTFSENIGAGPFVCTSADCSQALITAIKATFDAYMAEKGTADSAHYNSLMNKYFNEIGLGVAIDTENQKFYLTVHYGTSLK